MISKLIILCHKPNNDEALNKKKDLFIIFLCLMQLVRGADTKPQGRVKKKKKS